MNADLFLELTFSEVSQSQAVRTWDNLQPERPADLSKYDRLADARQNGDR